MKRAFARELAWPPASEQALGAVPAWQREVATVAQATLRDARTLPPLFQRDQFNNALSDAFNAIVFESQPPATALHRAADALRSVK